MMNNNTGEKKTKLYNALNEPLRCAMKACMRAGVVVPWL